MINDPLQIVLFLFTIPKCLNKVLSMLGAYKMLSIVFMSIQREIYSIYIATSTYLSIIEEDMELWYMIYC